MNITERIDKLLISESDTYRVEIKWTMGNWAPSSKKETGLSLKDAEKIVKKVTAGNKIKKTHIRIVKENVSEYTVIKPVTPKPDKKSWSLIGGYEAKKLKAFLKKIKLEQV